MSSPFGESSTGPVLRQISLFFFASVLSAPRRRLAHSACVWPRPTSLSHFQKRLPKASEKPRKPCADLRLRPHRVHGVGEPIVSSGTHAASRTHITKKNNGGSPRPFFSFSVKAKGVESKQRRGTWHLNSSTVRRRSRRRSMLLQLN